LKSLHRTTLTVSLVDDDNLVCQVDIQSFSGIAVKEEVVRQGDYLEDFSFRHPGTESQRNGWTSACEIASREAKYGQVWDTCPTAIRSSISFGDAFEEHETNEPEVGHIPTSI
jgi:hypothetical protein